MRWRRGGGHGDQRGSNGGKFHKLLVAWAAAGLATSPATGTFWITIACIAVLTRRYGIPAILTFRAIRRAPRHAALRGRRD